MKFQILTLILFSFFILSIPPSFSKPFGTRLGQGMGMRSWSEDGPCWRASDLNLSPDQGRRLELIQQAYLRETQLLRTELFSKRLELREFLTAPTVNMESIHAKNSEIIELQSKLEEKDIEYLIKVRTILTQEQLKKWCPEQEFPLFRRMMQGPRPMGPKHPKKP